MGTASKLVGGLLGWRANKGGRNNIFSDPQQQATPTVTPTSTSTRNCPPALLKAVKLPSQVGQPESLDTFARRLRHMRKTGTLQSVIESPAASAEFGGVLWGNRDHLKPSCFDEEDGVEKEGERSSQMVDKLLQAAGQKHKEEGEGGESGGGVSSSSPPPPSSRLEPVPRVYGLEYKNRCT